MAANDYYNPTASPANNPLPAHPQYQSHYTPDVPPSSSTPPYPTVDPVYKPANGNGQANGNGNGNNHNIHNNGESSNSPFDTPFDDRPYPSGRPAPQPYESQGSLGADSRYYGQGGGGRPQDSTGSFRDDIPLQDQAPPKDNYNNDHDHVYDAPIRPSNLEAGRPSRNSGFTKPKKSLWKQSWVCYIFGLIQVIVFIVEIVRNCRFRLSLWVQKKNADNRR